MAGRTGSDKYHRLSMPEIDRGDGYVLIDSFYLNQVGKFLLYLVFMRDLISLYDDFPKQSSPLSFFRCDVPSLQAFLINSI